MFIVANPVLLAQISNFNEIAQDIQKAKMKAKTGSRDVRVFRDSKEGVFVHMTWIYIWCFTLGVQDDKENIFRLNQLRQVLSKLKSDFRFNLKTDLFFLLIDACYNHASYKISSIIYETMIRYDVAPDNRIKLMQFN